MPFSEHKEFNINGLNNIPLWRYMDFWKFLDLLSTSELYFSSPNSFGDKNEGKIPDRIIEKMCEDPELGEEGANTYRNGLSHFAKEIYISSWVASKYESFALWKIYSKERLGVAIKTSLNGLKQSYKNSLDQVYIGRVSYLKPEEINYRVGNCFYSFLRKNIYYQFESEVRCIIKKTESNLIGLPGLKIPVDLESLIQEVVISPIAESVGQGKIIEKLAEERGLSFNITNSKIQDEWL